MQYVYKKLQYFLTAWLAQMQKKEECLLMPKLMIASLTSFFLRQKRKDKTKGEEWDESIFLTRHYRL